MTSKEGKKGILMFPMKCNKCGKDAEKCKLAVWTVVKLDCECGGRIETDYSKPYYE